MSDASDRLAQRLERIYERLTEYRVDAYLVPSSDAHLNEYVPTYQCRRAAISGFTGSAGDVLLSPHGNHLFVDSRYHLQAEQEVDTARFRVHKVGLADAHTLKGWLTEMEKQHGTLRVGFDPFLHPMTSHASYAKALTAAGSALVPIDANLIDEVWDDRPEAPAQPIYALPDDVTGRSAGNKLAAIRRQMADAEAGAMVVTKLDEIAWITNLRGSDIDYNPVFESYLVIDRQRATCFTRAAPSAALRQELASDVNFEAYEAYPQAVRRLQVASGQAVWLDPDGTTMGTRLLLPESASICERRNPVVAMKAEKNEAEIASMRRAHVHAAAAKIRSLARLEQLLGAGQGVSELAYSEMLHEEYSSEDGFSDLSFTTIAAAGPNGAIVHYSQASDEVLLNDGDLFLVDSGAQVMGGTTDDTRTVVVGSGTDRQRRLYTLVLRCHIQLARQKFPEGTSGAALDAVARSLMWNAGLDYGHGTGHGVGAFLNVHEGPQRISPHGSGEAMKPGMVVSNEPGYYEEGWGGIRLENLYVVVPDDDMPPHPSGKGWLRFEPLTLIPFDQRLIDRQQFSNVEAAWLDEYHERVSLTMGPLLAPQHRDWLRDACAPVA